jgi:peptidyl-prolyl cis-trans isomerase D
MTMLDRMRRHKNWLKWSLALVVLTFVLFYIPDFLTTNTGATPQERIAEVQGEAITVNQFTRRYNAQLQAYRQAYGGNVSEQLLRQLGIEQQILQQLVDEEATVAEARAQGLQASDAEVRARILALPAFQENGQFIGEQRYRELLSFQNPPLTTTEFENQLRRAILVEKLRNATTAWISVSDQAVADEYRRRNDKVKLDLVPLTAETFRSKVSATDAELQARFDQNKEAYRIGEKRKIKYATVLVDKVRETLQVPEADIEAFYKQNAGQYTTPGQVRASHILLQTEGKDDAQVKAKAEELLKRAKAGEDFAELARANSEDSGSAVNGGDLDYFGRGRMVPEFENAAFAMKAGEISDLVKSQFGYHIIKVTDSQPETTRALAEVRTEIEDQLKWQKAQAQAEQDAKALQAAAKTPADLEKAAKERGLEFKESPLFLADQPIGELGPAPQVAQRAFAMKDGDVSEPLRISTGWVVATLAGRQDAYLPQLAEVREKVAEDVVRDKAAELAKTKAAEIAATLKSASDFAAAAKKAGVEVKSTELIARGAPIPDIGVSPEIDKAAFALPVGGVSDPITTPQGSAIVRVAEKQVASDDEIAAARDQLRDELANAARDRFFSSYMLKAKGKMKIEIKQDVVARVMGPAPAAPIFPTAR